MSDFSTADKGDAPRFLVPVLLLLSLSCMAAFLALLVVPTLGWIAIAIAIAAVLVVLIAWRVQHGRWNGQPPRKGTQQLMLAGGSGLVLWLLGMVIALNLDLTVSLPALMLLGCGLALMFVAGLAGRVTSR
ncbi:hypothetical protein ACFFMR_25365 [Micromonospora andamanensis]|uniref:DUF2178 domain-containing protein n=1 Tax=Micromonospora andamanensis TaxID=1287068 RepID=A0ABQ4I032_9ACTN|nr:hypothetical protein [Micromonospora andamanensis]GIJ11216.1 hypothetical protein Van01_44300 [Micromonospora andamanensis]